MDLLREKRCTWIMAPFPTVYAIYMPSLFWEARKWEREDIASNKFQQISS